MKLPFQIDLEDKTVVITGAGGVLCSYFAMVLARCGAKVALLDLNPEVEAVAAQIRAKGGTAGGFVADVLNRESLNSAHQQVSAAFGPCDILINGAGGNHPKGTTSREILKIEELADKDLVSFFDLEPEGINFVFNLNFIGTLLSTQVFARDMVGRSGCTVINISSMNAFRPLTKIPAYSAAKAAISNFTQWLSVHFSSVGIRVNAIAPGFFVTHQNRVLLFDEKGQPTARADKILAHTPLGRFGNPEDLAGTLLWLVSREASAFITGVVIPVDGGYSAFSGV